MTRVAGKGDLYVHQDANWNVIGTTDLAGSVVEWYTYTPYGQLQAHKLTGYGDKDMDGDVDSTDEFGYFVCSDPPSGACRVLDLDFDGDLDSADETLFASLDSGLQRRPGLTATAVDQPFGHQGLLHDAEIGSYQNRARQYAPNLRRFAQRDALGIAPPKVRAMVEGLYVYVDSNPLRLTDATGLCPSPPPAIAPRSQRTIRAAGHGVTGVDRAEILGVCRA